MDEVSDDPCPKTRRVKNVRREMKQCSAYLYNNIRTFDANRKLHDPQKVNDEVKDGYLGREQCSVRKR